MGEIPSDLVIILGYKKNTLLTGSFKGQHFYVFGGLALKLI